MKLVRVVARVHMQDLQPGQTALVDINDDEVAGRIESGDFELVASRPTETPPAAPEIPSEDVEVAPSPAKGTRAEKAAESAK